MQTQVHTRKYSLAGSSFTEADTLAALRNRPEAAIAELARRYGLARCAAGLETPVLAEPAQ